MRGAQVLRLLVTRRGLGAAIALVAVSLIAPSASSKPSRPPTGSTCSLPATDLCTDYVTKGYRWPSMPLPYYINLAGAPAGAEQDIHDAFLAWEDEVKSEAVENAYPGDHSSVSFVFSGFTTTTGETDGMNVVYFRACDGCGAGSVDKRVRRKVNAEFDIFINANEDWSTDLTCPTQD